MFKFLLNCIIVLIFAPLLSAQVIEGTSNIGSAIGSSDIRLGAKAGLNISSLVGDNLETDPKLGTYFGGVAEIPILFDGFYLQPEVLFELQGAKIATGNLNLYYLHVPILGKYYVTDKIAVEFGPQIGFLVADNWDNNLSVIDTEKFNFGLNIGGGYLLNENIYFQVRFSPGVTKVLEATTIKNSDLQLGVCYFF